MLGNGGDASNDGNASKLGKGGNTRKLSKEGNVGNVGKGVMLVMQESWVREESW